ncbi:DUF554 domain-containing protein [Massilibacterium senegalense]|uniref:DUF554 domain-containing protein n=1 Tax=Massilibacterium senegalense TaxID=1632858 RepID=UPI0007804C72|nr:DUF554 domain-containing protein [Massilibacterium senegalense]
MVLLGTIMNAIAIVIGSSLGLVLTKIKERYKSSLMQVIALSVSILGIQMGLKSEQFLMVIGSLVIGTYLGERFDLDAKFNYLGKYVEKKVGAKEEGAIARGFVAATLLYCVGAMAILGSLDSGLRGNHDLLFTKSLLDGFTSILLTSTLGIGVMLAAIPVFLYQGIITLLAIYIEKLVPPEAMEMYIIEMTSVGGIMILAIGLNMLGLTKIRVANLLPAILVLACMVPIILYL